MDGLFQLLIIVLFVMAAVFDAVKRGREREQKKEEMEAAEEAEAVEFEVEGASPPPQPRPSRPRRPKAQEEESAETMVPEDLWAILTGQEPPSKPREEPVPVEAHPERAAEPDPHPEPDRRPDPHPEPDRRRDPHPEPDRLRESETRRSARWVAGLDRVAEEEAAAFGGLDEPWDEFADISQGEIDDGEGGAPVASSPYGQRGRGSTGRYRPALEGVDELRKAIVLKEVLGPPVGFREEDLR
jgi:hypothetical protein